MPSWQAHLINILLRISIKQLMRFGSLALMRSVIERHDSTLRALPESEEFEIIEVNKASFSGEKICRKAGKPEQTILYLPGGGFVMRTPVVHRQLVQKICLASQSEAFIVHYRLAPEHPFPAGLEDCKAAYLSLLNQGYEPENIVIAGDSAGGNLVLATLLALRDGGHPLPAAAVMLSALTDLTFSGESRVSNRWRDPMLPNGRSSGMHELYLNGTSPEDPRASPLFGDFSDLPPILGQVGSTEILLDDTTRVAEQARAVGTPFYLEIWNRMPHVWHTNNTLPEAGLAISRIAQFVRNKELKPPAKSPAQGLGGFFPLFSQRPAYSWDYHDTD